METPDADHLPVDQDRALGAPDWSFVIFLGFVGSASALLAVWSSFSVFARVLVILLPLATAAGELRRKRYRRQGTR